MSRPRRQEGSALRGFSVSFRHLSRLTDDTGVLEHALGRIPRRGEGYTTDDNARALWACVEAIDAFEGRVRPDDARPLQLADRYLAFLAWAQRPDGTFHNNFRYDRTPEPETPSDDCFARALWACAVAGVRLPDEDKAFAAADVVRRALPRVQELVHPRGWAYALAACCLLLEDGWLRGARSPWRNREDELYELVKRLEERLISRFREYSGPGWAWFDPVMTYGNGVLPWALFAAYRVTGSRGALETARTSLDFLIMKMTAPQGWIRPVGNRGWCTRESRAMWDQQPLEAMKLALACSAAYDVLERAYYRQVAEKCLDWFYGDNELQTPLADPDEGSCCDGLTPDGPNRNQGAESTIAYLLTELIVWKMSAGSLNRPRESEAFGRLR